MSLMPWHSSFTVLRLLALLAISEFVRTGFFVAYLPLKSSALNLGASAVGLIVGLHYLADGLAKGPSGVITERWGLGRMALAGAAFGTLALLLVPHAAYLAAALLLSLAWGLTLASLWPGVMTAVSHYAKSGKQSRALSWASVVTAPAIGLGAVGVGWLMQRLPSLGYPVLLGAELTALLLALSLLPLKLPRSGERVSPLRWARVAGLIPAAFAQTLAPGLLVAIFYPFLHRLGLSITDLLLPGLVAALVGLGALPLAGRLADRVHPRAALLPGLLLLAATFYTIALPGLPGHLYLVTALGGVAYACFIAGWNGLVARTLPREHRAAAWGSIMAVEALGYAVGPVLGGIMWDRLGTPGPFWLGAAVFLITLGYYLFPWRRAARSVRQAVQGQATGD